MGSSRVKYFPTLAALSKDWSKVALARAGYGSTPLDDVNASGPSATAPSTGTGGLY